MIQQFTQMSKSVLRLGILTASVLSAAQAFADPVFTAIPVTKVFTPKGFDSNDVSQVVVSGYLPSFCYKSPQSKVTITENRIQIQVTALFEENPEAPCAQAEIPILEKVSLGVLADGTYDVVVNAGTANVLEEKLVVAKTSNLESNDYMYARVDAVERPELSARKVILKGYNPSECFQLEEIRYISNEKDTYSVLPIMKKVGDFCPRKMMPFEYETTVPEELSAQTLLLHVRNMHGDSVNLLFENAVTEADQK